MNRLLEDFYKKPIAMQAVRLSTTSMINAPSLDLNTHSMQTEYHKQNAMMDDSSLRLINASTLSQQNAS